jgi:nitroreductase
MLREGHAQYLIATAARAPSVHNSQPWRFQVDEDAIELLPDPAQPRLVARVRPGRWRCVPMNALEVRMLAAVPHQHTHRGAFEPGPLPAGLPPGLQNDAFVEGAELAFIPPGLGLQRLAGLAGIPATAVLLTRGNRQADWLHAGQALHRMLLHAASEWVFASLYTQPLEDPVTRALIPDQLGIPDHPQMILQFGRAETTASTARRPADELTRPAS